MRQHDFQIGYVLLVALPGSVPRGREQEGYRPVIVVGVPDSTGPLRYPVIVIVPMTTQEGAWTQQNPVLYPRLEAGTGGLVIDSVALIDQVRGLDCKRILRYLGALTSEHYQPVAYGLKKMLEQTK